MIDRPTFWLVTLGLGLGTYFIRFSFLGALGNRQLPRWMLRGLRYTGVAVLPALVAPAIAWPVGGSTQSDAVRLAVAVVTLGLGVAFRNTIAAILGGAATLFLLPLILPG